MGRENGAREVFSRLLNKAQVILMDLGLLKAWGSGNHMGGGRGVGMGQRKGEPHHSCVLPRAASARTRGAESARKPTPCSLCCSSRPEGAWTKSA